MELEKQFFIAGYVVYEYYRYLTTGYSWSEIVEVLEDLGRLILGLLTVGAALVLVCSLVVTEEIR